MSNKVLVKLNTASSVIIPSFSQCILNILQPGCDIVSTALRLDDNYLTLSLANRLNDIDKNYDFHHSAYCPFKELEVNKCSEDLINPDVGIAVAVSVLVESSDHKILLTKRPVYMRASPGVWVPPGGHLEPGESLLAGGARELFEETGLSMKIDCEENKAEVLCLWENVYPILLGQGTPTRHSVVVYFHVTSQYTETELTNRMHIDPVEVAAFAWMPRQVLNEIFDSSDLREPTFPLYQYVWNNHSLQVEPLNYLTMFRKIVWRKEQLFSGAQCALMKWYDKITNQTAGSKL